MCNKLLSILALTFCIGIGSQSTFAARECDRGYIEPNNTFAEATAISRNNSDHPDIMYEYYLGSMETSDDVDIFSVTLPAGENTIIVQPYYADLRVELISASDEVVTHQEIFTKQNRQSDLELNINEAGRYYVRISIEPNTQTDMTKEPSYRLLVGNPYYSMGSYTHRGLPALTITPRRKTSTIVPFDLSNISSIPEGSLVDSIRFGGRESDRISGRVRSAKPQSYWRWFDGREYWFEADNISSAPIDIFMKQEWEYKHYASSFGYTQQYTLTPEVYFKYYYKQNLDE